MLDEITDIEEMYEKVASFLHGVPLSKVTAEMRKEAKLFLIHALYGGCDRREAPQ